MAKSNNNMTGRRSTSYNSKPYDANNSFVKKVATKVTDLIPQRSWISKWFNTSHGNGNILNLTENDDDTDCDEEVQQQPPLKRPRIRMDITHPPGTFCIQSRPKSSANQSTASKQFSGRNDAHHEFLEPDVAGPSGVVTAASSTTMTQTSTGGMGSDRSELNAIVTEANNGAANGTDDNSESSESTSGCSSLIPQTNRQEVSADMPYNSSFSFRKKCMDDKLSFTSHLQSPRSLFLESNTRDSLSSRRPSFNASIMTTSTDRGSPLSSPFYSGNITFGGANAAGLYKRSRTLLNTTDELNLKVPKRTSVEVKSSNSIGVDPSGMSQTAKKILEALEHFSSPIADAKKIPVKGGNHMGTSLSKKRQRSETSPSPRIGLRHLTRELNVPTVPDILKLRRRQKLQDTTVLARKIASAHSKPPPIHDYHIRTQNDEDSKHHGKVKAKSKSKLDEENTIEPLSLPNIPLPISSLPSFQFTPPQVAKKVDTKTGKEDNFIFASPIKVASMEKNLKSINNFTFSSPIDAEAKKCLNSHSETKSFKFGINSGYTPSSAVNHTSTLTQNFNWPGTPTGPKLREKPKEVKKTPTDAACSKLTNTSASISKELKELSNASKISADDKSTTSSFGQKNLLISSFGVWECSECLIKNNNSESHCVACKASKPNSTNQNLKSSVTSTKTEVNTNKSVSFESKFKMSTDQWECPDCYLRNKENDVKCVACNAVKPSMKQKSETNANQTVNSDSINQSIAMEKMWECSGCKLKNNASLSVCLKCNSSKPGTKDASLNNKNTSAIQIPSTDKTFASMAKDKVQSTSTFNTLDKLKPSTDTWECPCCMVRNAATLDACPCCNTNNPNCSKTIVKKPTVEFSSGFGDKFKKPEGCWTCDACMVQNKPDITECVACTTPKPGTKKSVENTSNTKSSLQFSFGIPPSAGGFKFGVPQTSETTSSNASSPSLFTFGQTQTSNQKGQFSLGMPKEGTNDATKSDNVTPAVSQTKTDSSVQKDISDANKGDINKATSIGTVSASDSSIAAPKSGSTTSSNLPSTTSTGSTLPQTAAGFIFQMPKSNPPTDANTGDQSNVASVATAATTKSNLAVTQSESGTSIVPPGTTVSGENNSQKSPPAPIFSFGAPSSVSGPVATNTATNFSSGTQSLFTLPESKTNAQASGTTTFGQTVTTTASNMPAPFTFGKKLETSSTENTSQKNVIPSTGDSVSTDVGNPTPLLNNTETKATPILANQDKSSVFGSTSGKLPTFGTPDNDGSYFKNTENKSPFFGTKLPVFGSTDKPTSVFNPTTPTTTAGFGTTTNKSFFESSTASTFGSTPNFGTESTTNIFSTTKANETNVPSSKIFTFGAKNSEAGTGFNFSANNTNASPAVQKPVFTFGASTNTSQSNLFGGAAFNNPAPVSSTPFTFNAPKPEVPAFGQGGATPSVFGAPQTDSQNPPPSFSTPMPNAGFNFGSAAPAASPGGYNFARSAPTPTPSEGFNFNRPNTTPVFNPNTRPSFDFTRGSVPAAFNSTVTPPLPGRKIKVAVRRKR